MWRKVLLIAFVVNNIVASDNVRSAFDDDLYEDVLDPVLCEEQLDFLYNDSLRLQFYDASGRYPSGVDSGNLNDFGDYHQCLGIDEYVNDMDIKGKYCTVTVPLDQEPIVFPDIPDLPEIVWPPVTNQTVKMLTQYYLLKSYANGLTGIKRPSNGDIDSRMFPMITAAVYGMTIGVCVPKVCTPTQAIDFLQERIVFSNVTFREYYCRLPNDKPFVPADYVAISIFSFIGLLCLLSTAYDLHHNFVRKLSPSQANTILRSFSVYTNTRRFLTFNSVPGALECLDGIRAISMLWVVVGHVYCLTLGGYIHNLQYTLNWTAFLSSTWINAAPITVDTFFLLSGILVVYTTVGKISRARFVRSIHLFYLNRLLRMFPLLACLVLLQASLFNHFSDGPFWQNVAFATENCRKYWWSALLHVQNYVNPVDMCLTQTWYLSVDIQLYIVCPLVLVFLFGRQVYGWCAISFAILLSLVGSSIISFTYDFSAGLSNPSRLYQLQDYLSIYYFSTLARAPPFCVGLMYGYILHHWRGKKITIPTVNVALLWTISALLMLFCIFSIYPVMQPDHDVQLMDNFLNAYMRAIWAIGLGWLIVACVHGYGGPVNWFLSLKLWKLPARLSYAMYLIHFPQILVSNGSWLKTHYFGNGEAMYRFAAEIVFTFVAAFVLCITVDAPFSTLQKLMMGGGKRPQRPKEEPQNNLEVNKEIMKTSL